MKKRFLTIFFFSTCILIPLFSQFAVKTQIGAGINHFFRYHKSSRPFDSFDNFLPGYTYTGGADLSYALSDKNGLYASIIFNVRNPNVNIRNPNVNDDWKDVYYLTNEIGFYNKKNAMRNFTFGIMNNFSLGNADFYTAANAYNLGLFLKWDKMIAKKLYVGISAFADVTPFENTNNITDDVRHKNIRSYFYGIKLNLSYEVWEK